MNFRITRRTGPRWNFIERFFSERGHDIPPPLVLPEQHEQKTKKKEAKTSQKHTRTMSLVDHFMNFDEE